MRLLDTKDLPSLGLSQVKLFERAVDLEGQLGLELLLLRVRETEIGKNVSTAFFNASISISSFCLNTISKAEFLISGLTDSINGTFSKDLLMALLHMAQVSPVACSLALVNWACP